MTTLDVLDEVRAAAVRLRQECGGRLAADEAGAIQHEHDGRHDRTERCVDCGRDGRALLEQLAGFAARPAGSVQPPRARATDPATSHAAAATINSGTLTARQAAVLLLFREVGWMTDDEVAARYGCLPGAVLEQSPSGLRTRRHELVEQGLVIDTGQRRQTAAGNRAIVWGITAAGLRAIRGKRAA